MILRFPPLLRVALGLAALTLPCPAEDDGWMPLFDGKTLENWDGDPRFWRVEDGALTGETTADNPTNGNTFIIWTGGVVGDFELELEYRIQPGDPANPGGNSGIQYRSFRLENAPDKWRIGGYQADFETGETWSGILYGEAFRGILAKRGEKTEIGEDGTPKLLEQIGDSAELQSKIRKEDWNTYQITARDFHFVHRINGHVTAEVIDNDTDTRRATGLLALQLHAGPPMKVQFRNVRIRPLPAEAETAAAPAEAADGALLIELKGDGSVRVGGHDLDPDQLKDTLAAHRDQAAHGVLVRATAETPAKQVAAVVESCHAAGVLNVRFELAR